MLVAALTAAGFGGDSEPPLRAWQAKRIAHSYAAQQQRPGYAVVAVSRVSDTRLRVTGHEPGYAPGFIEDGPDVTRTLVERRGYQLWIRDPFRGRWIRWL